MLTPGWASFTTAGRPAPMKTTARLFTSNIASHPSAKKLKVGLLCQHLVSNKTEHRNRISSGGPWDQPQPLQYPIPQTGEWKNTWGRARAQIREVQANRLDAPEQMQRAYQQPHWGDAHTSPPNQPIKQEEFLDEEDAGATPLIKKEDDEWCWMVSQGGATLPFISASVLLRCSSFNGMLPRTNSEAFKKRSNY